MRSRQRNRLSDLQTRVVHALVDGLTGPWWLISLRLIAVLLGFAVASTLTVNLAAGVQSRTTSALVALAVCELLVLFRRLASRNGVPLHWRLLDNIRIGFVYGVALEAFKIGS